MQKNHSPSAAGSEREQCRRSGGVHRAKSRIATFQTATWTIFAVQAWALDFGRPVVALWLPSLTASSFSWISFGDVAHVAYIYFTALCLVRLQDHSSRPVPPLLHRLLLVTFVLGATVHLVADSVQSRLVRAGAIKLHLPIKDQPLLQTADPSVVECFKFLDYLDEQLGHQVWYTALYLLFLLYFWSCFYHPTTNNTTTNTITTTNTTSSTSKQRIFYFPLIFVSALHEWYAVTEAQVFPHFLATCLTMTAIFAWCRWHGGCVQDPNGEFLMVRFLLTLPLVGGWVASLWRDETLREKYRESLLYVPEPWSFVSLHLTQH